MSNFLDNKLIGVEGNYIPNVYNVSKVQQDIGVQIYAFKIGGVDVSLHRITTSYCIVI